MSKSEVKEFVLAELLSLLSDTSSTIHRLLPLHAFVSKQMK
jgi:hypothetical protein